jgi:hypothetical protein
MVIRFGLNLIYPKVMYNWEPSRACIGVEIKMISFNFCRGRTLRIAVGITTRDEDDKNAGCANMKVEVET